ncbi:MAG: HEAT repeat domain-containing protein [Treponema sp.]|jgi:HEAT repeat protein|nr:HEAT repeat domain-containing protein [Treponema sp.]
MMKFKYIVCFLLTGVFAYSQNIESSRREIIQYGTETEIVSLIQALVNEKADYLDDELAALIDTTKNQKILNGVFSFFGERGKNGLEERAIKAVVERENEANETVHSAVEYLGRVKSQDAVPVIIELLDSEEKRFFSTAFRALGRASSDDKALADEAAEFLVDFYTYRDPGDDNKRELITAIGTTGSLKGVPMLTEIVSDTNERIPLRIAALDALSKIGDNSGLEAILVCVSTNDPNVRSAAVGALGPFSGEEVDKAILDAFRDSYYRTRIAAAQASRDRKFAEAVPYLKFRAERDEVPNVKDEAIRALGAIGNEEANSVLENLFTERKNSDRVRIITAEMVMKNEPDKNFKKLIVELDDAKTKNQTALYNGLLKVIGETVIAGDKTDIENITRRFLRSGTIIEKSYGLDMAANNNLSGLSAEITDIIKDKNESISRKAGRTAEKLGIEITNEQKQ